MRIYRIHSADGREQTIAADRVVADGTSTRLEVRDGREWQVVVQVPSAGIASIALRVTEIDGSWSWVRTEPEPEPEVRVSGHAALGDDRG